MTRSEAAYFLEGMTAGLAAPDKRMAKVLFRRVARKYGLCPDDLRELRREIDVYLDEAEEEATPVMYKGFRLRTGVCQVTRNGRKLDLRLDLMNHSPTGFEWGYGGSGPAQTALAILADYLNDDDRAIKLHQKFKWDLISKLPHGNWSISSKFLRAWLKLHESEMAWSEHE